MIAISYLIMFRFLSTCIHNFQKVLTLPKKIIFQKTAWSIKKAEFYPDFNFVEITVKKVLGKSYSQIFCILHLFAYTHFWREKKIEAEITDSVSVSNSAFLKPHTELLTKLFCGSS